MNWVNHIFDEEWSIHSAGGLTGDALFAKRNDKQLFLKRNTTPFLAVLSVEEIVPKLVWTKRLQNGDVITAQEWIDGRKLTREEMRNEDVLRIVRKIHQSPELLHMLVRMGKKENDTTIEFNELYNSCLQELLHRHPTIYQALHLLKQLLPATKMQNQVVCHSDLNHNNFIRRENGELYLVDWDQACIADPVKDYGTLLYHYIPESEWSQWLSAYDETLNDSFLRRMYWYVLYETVSFIVWHHRRGEQKQKVNHLNDLARLKHKISSQLSI
ncbi:MAG TPA: phosphotransferase family protein [Bacillota bacterium]|nr:phosphotransferase family protein [Bacillota bacterium]